jgi:hypothetical protein
VIAARAGGMAHILIAITVLTLAETAWGGWHHKDKTLGQ